MCPSPIAVQGIRYLQIHVDLRVSLYHLLFHKSSFDMFEFYLVFFLGVDLVTFGDYLAVESECEASL